MPRSSKYPEPVAPSAPEPDVNQPEESPKATTVLSFRADRNIRNAVTAYQERIERICRTPFTRNDVLLILVEQQLIAEGVLPVFHSPSPADGLPFNPCSKIPHPNSPKRTR